MVGGAGMPISMGVVIALVVLRISCLVMKIASVKSGVVRLLMRVEFALVVKLRISPVLKIVMGIGEAMRTSIFAPDALGEQLD